MPTLHCRRMLVDRRLDGPFAVAVEDGVVAAVERRGPRAGDRVLGAGVLTAGMCDLQVNGAAGVDLAHADAAGWRAVADHLARHGVTAFCPAFITAPPDELAAALGATAAAMRALAGAPAARPAGAHLEGPFLSPAHPGVHPVEHLRPPSPEALDALLGGPHAGAPAIVTLAPELEGGLDAIARLRDAGVACAIGHSDATAAQTAAAADAGATLVTHLFNAQRRFAHREPGVAGRALVDDRLVCGLIADLHHVAADAIRLAFAAAPGRIALVSDAVAAAGTPAGTPFRHGPLHGVSRGELPPVRDDGRLAGAAALLDAAVRNVVALGLPAAVALDAATAVPARAIGRRARIAPGEPADLVWWDDDLRVRAVWIGGAEAGR